MDRLSGIVLVQSPQQGTTPIKRVGPYGLLASAQDGTLLVEAKLGMTPTKENTQHCPRPPMPKIRIYSMQIHRNRAQITHSNRINEVYERAAGVPSEGKSKLSHSVHGHMHWI